ncbi:MAG: hypothetical protein ACREGF_06470, partial [Candidatus Saccharimonadales bacterium]
VTAPANSNKPARPTSKQETTPTTQSNALTPTAGAQLKPNLCDAISIAQLRKIVGTIPPSEVTSPGTPGYDSVQCLTINPDKLLNYPIVADATNGAVWTGGNGPGALFSNVIVEAIPNLGFTSPNYYLRAGAKRLPSVDGRDVYVYYNGTLTGNPVIYYSSFNNKEDLVIALDDGATATDANAPQPAKFVKQGEQILQLVVNQGEEKT